MSFRLQIIIAIATAIAFFYIGNKVRTRVIELKYALVWFLLAIVLLIMDLAPNLMEQAAHLMGVTLPINMLTLLGFGFVLIILYSFTLVLTNENRRTKRLTQEVALLNKRLEILEEKLAEAGIEVESPISGTADPRPQHDIEI
ncbi:MAG: DUF2304 domain-containing protein [Lachnospiraceae bacterium]|nr:DUF2304 domain-containing protein [Lachnospiraceae bacterium]